ncbi:hypothetical protein AR158_c231L [Paramecium bursaria Chlorella virus AR158]|uniref:hypothetical protein n=1 Tax=Paramecium bursaria Chlorella virus AR158 TaxID=380598 RepID=UPI00015AA881|nr:hypothetical protein AR158_c231L [Paramecium bursaria Chlorella virus AR158]ABU43777.1 hypothetical protein AR158_c231L [Paramecium bursaria Chlorella virus AR158]
MHPIRRIDISQMKYSDDRVDRRLVNLILVFQTILRFSHLRQRLEHELHHWSHLSTVVSPHIFPFCWQTRRAYRVIFHRRFRYEKIRACSAP